MARITITVTNKTSRRPLLHHELELSMDQAKACLAEIGAQVAAISVRAQISRRYRANGSLVVDIEFNRATQPTFEQLFRRAPGTAAQASDVSPE
ncbi:MAG TPA: hypothetical protein VGD99_11900 [Anaerolineae bacterium]|jgi:hypothetical protein